MNLGIDFGTTRTVVAQSDRGNYPVVTFFDGAGAAAEYYPTVLAEREGQLRFGFDALEAAREPGWTLVRSFKRFLGQKGVTPSHVVRLGSSDHALGDVVTGFLASLRHALVNASNAPALKDGEALRAFVSTPAHALGPQRFLTLDAFRRAGFEVRGLLNEPSAAGFEYTHRYRKTLTAQRDQVLVYDLGGGTFDAALVRMHAQAHDVVATRGLGTLGGDDFDDVLAAMVVRGLGKKQPALSPEQSAALALRARDAKEALTPNSRRVVVDLEGLGLLKSEFSAVATDYYDACVPLVDQTLDACSALLPGEDESGALAGLYVVGGASALPVVARRLKEVYGRRVHRSPYPSAAIAMGLAIAGDDEAGYELSDRLSRTFGVFREARGGQDVSFDEIFGRDERLPGAKALGRAVRRVYRAAHNVGCYRFVEANELDDRGLPRAGLHTFGDVTFAFDPTLRDHDTRLNDVPVRRLSGRGPLVQEEYRVSELGLVEVALTDLDTGYARTFTLGAQS